MSANSGIFFLLGAGASVDSGLPTYRGVGGIYAKGEEFKPETELHVSRATVAGVPGIWDVVRPMYKAIAATQPGPTYQKLKEVAARFPGSFVLTQNIDGFARSIDVPLVELHGNYSLMRCLACKTASPTETERYRCLDCGALCRPNVVLFGEAVPSIDETRVHKLLKRHVKYVVVIGSTLQFPYLRAIINKAKGRQAKVIHINPHPDTELVVTRHEVWIRARAVEGLEEFERWAAEQERIAARIRAELNAPLPDVVIETEEEIAAVVSSPSAAIVETFAEVVIGDSDDEEPDGESEIYSQEARAAAVTVDVGGSPMRDV